MWLLITAEVSAGWVQINLLLKIRVKVVPLGFLSQIITPTPLISHLLRIWMQTQVPFIWCHFKPILTLTIQPFSKIPCSNWLTYPLYTFPMLPCAFISALSSHTHAQAHHTTQTHTKAHRFVKYLFHLLCFIIPRFIIAYFLSLLVSLYLCSLQRTLWQSR